MNNSKVKLNYMDDCGDLYHLPLISQPYKMTVNQSKQSLLLSYKPQLTHDQSYELAVTKFCNMIIGRSR